MYHKPEARSPKRLYLVGPTAVGKTSVALVLAKAIGAEIVGADSRQVYRGMDIGTAKPTPLERAAVAHHLLDVADPDEPFAVADYLRLAHNILTRLEAAGTPAVVVGGTGLYIRALRKGLCKAPPADPLLRARLLAEEQREGAGVLHRRLLAVDPVAAGRIPPGDLRRIVRALEVHLLTGVPLSALQQQWQWAPVKSDPVVGLAMDRSALARRIDDRVDAMMARGFLEEVRGVLARGDRKGLPAMQGLGYRELADHLEGLLSLDEAIRLMKKRTKAYAKRQETWFRREEGIRWVEVLPDETPEAVAAKVKKSVANGPVMS